MSLPKLIILDRDGTLNFASPEDDHPLYYITRVENLVIKPGVQEAVNLIKACQIPMVLATKQRCISQYLVSLAQVDIIHARLERLLDIKFDNIYIEDEWVDKTSLYPKILKQYSIPVRDIVLFDDSVRERKVAADLGIGTYDGTNLLDAVKAVLKIS